MSTDDTDDTDDDTPVPFGDLIDNDVVVMAGDAEEDTGEYDSLRADLAAAYGVQTRLEEILLDRVVQLRWRLARVARTERGRIGRRSADVVYKAGRTRRADARRHLDEIERGARGVAVEDGELVIRSVRAEILMQLLLIRSGQLPDQADAKKALGRYYGYGANGRLWSQGMDVELAIEEMHEDAADPELSDRSRKRRAKVHREFVFAHVNNALADLDRMVELAEVRAEIQDHALVESVSIPDADSLKALAAYERQLDHALERATRDLQRAVARRRLASAARRAGLG